MPSEEDINEQQKLLAIYRKTLAMLLEQRAIHTVASVPPAVEHGIDEARQNIQLIKDTLRGWRVQVSDNPNDEGDYSYMNREEFTRPKRSLIVMTGRGRIYPWESPYQLVSEALGYRRGINFNYLRLRTAHLQDEYLTKHMPQNRVKKRGQKPDVVIPMRYRIMIYWHNEGLTKVDALELVGLLADIGIEAIITKHLKETAPDAVFISPEAPASLIRLILAKLTYNISYLFPVDYPDPECGALSDFAMSVGLQSATNKEFRSKKEEPIRLKRGQLKRLVEPGLNDYEFRHRLIKIASHND